MVALAVGQPLVAASVCRVRRLPPPRRKTSKQSRGQRGGENQFHFVLHVLFDWFGLDSVQIRLQFYHFHIADVSVFLQFIQHGLRRRAVQAQHRQRQPARRVAPQAHARDVDLVFAEQRAEMADDAGLVRVVQQQQRAA